MGVFEAIGSDTHEEVLFGSDPVSGLRCIIAIHSTALGPALGGTRFFPYPSEADALRDVLRLARAMTYKAAAAGLDLGGGKAVIIGDPASDKSERLLRAYGRVVDSLGGRYVTAEDVGTTTADMEVIARETRSVTGVPTDQGGSGDPSPATALGVMAAMRAVAERIWGTDDLSGKRVAIQGVGKVGSSLAGLLSKAGAVTIVADVDHAAVQDCVREYGSVAADTTRIFDVESDLFAPCALGGALDAFTIPKLTCAAVVGSANNQLATAKDADRLAERGIVYVPDFVANAGGIINITEELRGYSWDRAARAIDRIYETTHRVLDAAKRDGSNAHDAAVAMAEERIQKVGSLAARRRPGARSQ